MAKRKTAAKTGSAKRRGKGKIPNARTRAAIVEARAIRSRKSSTPDDANLAFGLACEDFDVEPDHPSLNLQEVAWIPNARTRAAIEEARRITLYRSARNTD